MRFSFTYYLSPIVIFFFIAACSSEDEHHDIRPELIYIFARVDSSRINGRAVEESKRYLDSILTAYSPLSKSEQLYKYDYDHWYYREYLWAEHEQTNKVIDSALSLFLDKSFRQKNMKTYRRWLLFKGDVLVDLKRLNEAFYYYHEAKTSSPAEIERCRVYSLTTRLSFVRYKQKNYDDAIKYNKQALKEYRVYQEHTELNDYYQAVTEPQGMMNGIGWFYDLNHQPDSALHYYRMALAFMEEKSIEFPFHKRASDIARGVIYGNIGGLLTQIDRYEEAEQYLKKSIAINSQPTYDNRDVITAQIKLANLYIKTGRLRHAKELLTKFKKGIDSIPSDDMIERMKKTEWLYLDSLGDETTSYAAFRDYHTFKDSLLDADQYNMSADFEKEFEHLEQKKIMDELIIKNRNNYISLIITIILLVMTLAIVYLIYNNWQRSKRYITKLRSLNDHINEKNEKLQVTLTALQESQQDNTRILAMVAHDLRGPIGNIKTGADLLLQREQSAIADRPKLLDIIRRTSLQALSLIDELMYSYEHETFSNTNAINLENMIHDCVNLMKIRANEKEQVIEVYTEQVTFNGSGEKMWRIISNLIINAIKFTPRKGNIVVKLQQIDEGVCIKVSDNGIGVPAHMLVRIFEMGKEASRPGTEGERSTGLGLAIVKQIVTSYEGTIEVKSTPNVGTTFRVILPLR